LADGTSIESSKKTARPNQQRGGYSAELELFLTTTAALMGERSNFDGQVAAIERGGSGGNSGTKGVGVIRIEMFESWESLDKLHKTFDRSRRCLMSWRMLSQYERDLAEARYLYCQKKLPPGLHGQLGDLSLVAYVVAERLGLSARLVRDIASERSRQWENVCAIAVEELHASWCEARAAVNEECEDESVKGGAQ
jgi:hypothetical protein